MSAMEQSLRRALEAGDSGDPAFRESIYSASERALERMLASKGTDPEAAHVQRVRLAETINRVEEDYFTALADEDGLEPASDDLSADPAPRDGDGDGDASFDAALALPDPAQRNGEDEGDDVGEGEPPRTPAATGRDDDDLGSWQAPAEPDTGAAAEPWSPGGGAARWVNEAKAKRRRSRPFLFGAVVLLFALVAGIVFFYLTVFAPMETSASTSGTTVAGEDGAMSAADDAAWITVFDGTQLEMISTPTGGEVSAIAGPGDKPAVRIAAADEAGEVDVSIGPGVVNGIKGRTVRVEITAGSNDGSAREFGVRCLFGGDTVCGRQRFSTVQDSESFVFDMVVPSDPAASGTIAIDPSFGAGAKTIDLYSVRLRPVAGA